MMHDMQPLIWHLSMEALAWMAAGISGVLLWRWRLAPVTPAGIDRPAGYLVTGLVGLTVGSFMLGTANLWLSGVHAPGRSALGALLGATLAIEGYKSIRGIRGSTGAYFVGPIALGIALGRLGCFHAGLHDHTYGIATALPVGVDFGDGVRRHPVQLYEAFVMAAGFGGWCLWLARAPQTAARFGFAVLIGFYGLERFGLEFLKPYARVVGPLNLFHLACLVLMVVAVVLFRRQFNRPLLA